MKFVKIKPGSKKENEFLEVLKSYGVNEKLLIKKSCEIFGKDYNEYQLSDGLFHVIKEDLSKIGGILNEKIR